MMLDIKMVKPMAIKMDMRMELKMVPTKLGWMPFKTELWKEKNWAYVKEH